MKKIIESRKIIWFIGLYLCCFTSLATASGEKQIIYNSYITSDMTTWKKTIDMMHAERDKSNEREMELLNYEYGYVGWCIGNKRKKEAKIYISRSLERMERLKTAKYNLPLVNAYTSAFLGFRIGMEPFKAPKLGPQSLAAAKKSIAEDSRNASGYIQLGNIDFFMPAAFGGSKDNAIKNYLRAEQLMAPTGKGDWNYLALLVQMATAYEAVGKLEMAESYLQKTLSIAPNFSWVKDELYPVFKKKHNKL